MSEASPFSIFKVEKFFDISLGGTSKTAKADYGTLVRLAREAICFNQSMLVQYQFFLGNKHKILKDEFRNKDGSRKSSYSHEDLRRFYGDLRKYSYDTLKTVADKNFSYILRYFQARHSEKPRVCLKIIAGDSIMSLARDSTSSLTERYYDKAENTAFKKICMGESLYVSNDIPREAQKSLYVNARISNREKLRSYRPPNVLNNFLAGFPNSKIHTTWKDCWERIDADETRKDLSELPSETCYKSTLVIPLSLKRIDLESAFIEQFGNAGDDQSTERLIFGFLCFDHQTTNFFNKDVDLEMGRIFADILSLYLVTRKMYTDCSTTFEAIRLELDNT
jgi:hypothetical protein